VGFAVAQWGAEIGLGFSYIVSTGNELDIDSLEVAAHLADDDDAEIVVLLIEGFRDIGDFERVGARFRQRRKPLIVAKLGQSPAGARAALAHTSHVAGDPDGYSALFSAYGVLEAGDEEELRDIIQSVAKAGSLAGRRIGIVTTSGGAGVWLTDACQARGLEVPELTQRTQELLKAHMPSFGSPVNPVDLTAQFITGGAFAPALEVLLASGEVDGVVLVTSLSSPGRLASDHKALAELTRKFTVPLFVYSYVKPAQECIDILNDLGLPWYTSSNRAARGLAISVSQTAARP
jgi:acyl-CoA synthetase (NDP forming)